MDALRRSFRRDQLDAQLVALRGWESIPTPKGGWIRAIREALGMSLEQFAHRLGHASSSTTHQLERAEIDESLTIKRMRAAADALGCDLVVALVPREPLQQMAERQAMRKSSERLARVGHTMALEVQSVGMPEMDALLRKTATDILDRGGAQLWD